MGLIEVKTAELTGPALDWAVAQVVSHPADLDQSSGCLWFESSDLEWIIWSPSTDWAQGGPLRDKYRVGIEPGGDGDQVYAYTPGRDLDGAFADTALIALCRAIVAAEQGDVVQVPAELVGVVA